jgi:tRNA-splicing ligase RtcB
LRGEFAKALLKAPPPPRAEPVKYRQWGEHLEHDAVMQMEKACLLPVSVAGALMPDAHVGYGLPIGGVLATKNAVIPYAVGLDIACRMKMTVLDIPVRDLEHKQDRLTRAIEAETRFGVGANFKGRRVHDVLEADWSVSPITKQNKNRAWSQLGTSGSGNHFVEFGLFTAHSDIHELKARTYVALLSHSGRPVRSQAGENGPQWRATGGLIFFAFFKADGVAVRCAQSSAKWRSRFAILPASHPESLPDPRNRRCSSPSALCP